MIVILISIWLRNLATSVGLGYIIHNHKHITHKSLGKYFHKLYSMYLCSFGGKMCSRNSAVMLHFERIVSVAFYGSINLINSKM